MKDCKWLNVSQLTDYHSLLQLFKTVHWGTPHHLDNKITILDDNTLITKPPRLIVTNGYRCKTASTWTYLPSHIRLETRIGAFKK